MHASMDHVHPDLTLAILAGGRGRRMGGIAKPLMRLDGRSFLERLLELRSQVGDAIIVANDPSPYAPFDVRVVSDRIADRGAPGGLHAALSTASTGWVLLVAGDMPFVHAQAIDFLVRHIANDVEWVCFERDGRLEPMPGLYRVGLRDRFELRLAEGQPSFRAVLEGVPGVRISSRALAEVDPALRALTGVNTPEEAARIGATRPPGQESGSEGDQAGLNRAGK